MLNPFSSPLYNKIFKILVIFYILFSVILIFRSSVVGIDGQRHFILFDDAMISMRYANNLAQGNGLVWNIGEKVEGFTNPLMVFIMSAAITIFGENYAALFIQLLGLSCLVVNIYLVIKILKKSLGEEYATDFFIFSGTFLVMTFYPLIYWSVFGMDTGILTTLVLLSIYVSIYKNKPKKINFLLAIILGLIYLTRPEGLLFITLFYIFRLSKYIYDKTGWFKIITEGTVTLIPIIAYQIFRVNYYGQNYPNTYILKATGMPLLDKLKNGIGFYEPFLNRVEFLLFAITLFFFVYLFESNTPLKEKVVQLFVGKFRFITFFSLSFVVFSAYQIFVGGDPWPPAWRMTVPYIILMFIAFICSMAKLKQSFNLRSDLTLAFTSCIMFSFVIFAPFDYHYDFMRLEPYQTRNNAGNVNVALIINKLTTNNATVLSSWAGTIPYLTHRYSIDPLGKMDPYIARLPPDLSGAFSSTRGMYSVPGHNKYDLNYSMKQKQPDVIISNPVNGHLCSWALQNLEDWCMLNYTLLDYNADYYGSRILLRKNSRNILWDKIENTNIITNQ